MLVLNVVFLALLCGKPLAANGACELFTMLLLCELFTMLLLCVVFLALLCGKCLLAKVTLEPGHFFQICHTIRM